jgi:hypothetical protein
MALWWPPTWSRRDAPDLWEYVSAVISVFCSAWAALAPAEKKTLPAVLAALAGVSTLTAKFASRKMEQQAKAGMEARARSQMKRTVSAILEEMRQEYFAHEAGDEKYKHRITLFVCVESDGGTNGAKHLAIFARSGVHLDSQCTWPVDDNHPTGCRGVAGKIWYHNITDIKIALCDWPRDNDQTLKVQYAQSLEISVEEAEALNVKSRAFAGAPVLVNGKKWGVLLLDSLKDGFIADNAHKKGLLNRYTELIGRVLTEAGI